MKEQKQLDPIFLSVYNTIQTSYNQNKNHRSLQLPIRLVDWPLLSSLSFEEDRFSRMQSASWEASWSIFNGRLRRLCKRLSLLRIGSPKNLLATWREEKHLPQKPISSRVIYEELYECVSELVMPNKITVSNQYLLEYAYYH